MGLESNALVWLHSGVMGLGLLKNGIKTITVTTNNNGKETVKIYKGEEADSFLKNTANGTEIIIIEEDEN